MNDLIKLAVLLCCSTWCQMHAHAYVAAIVFGVTALQAAGIAVLLIGWFVDCWVEAKEEVMRRKR